MPKDTNTDSPSKEIDVSSLLTLDGETLTIDAATAQGTVFAEQLGRLTGDMPIVVGNASREVTRTGVNVNGTSSLLNVRDIPVTASATLGGDITVRFTLINGRPGPNAWRFSHSFPDFPDFDEGAPPSSVNLLDRLSLSDAAFVLTTAAGTDPLTGAAVQPGFNFVARLAPVGMFGLLGGSIEGGGISLPLSGPVVLPNRMEQIMPSPEMELTAFPWQSPRPAPGIHLSADLGIDRRVGDKLRLHDVGLRVYCPPSAVWARDNPTYAPALAATAKLDVPSADISLDITAAGLASPDTLMLFGLFEGLTLGRLEQLVDAAGGSDLAGSLPADVQAALGKLGALSLDSFMLQFGKGFAVNSVGIEVGLPGINTNVLPGINVRSLTANFSVVEPFGEERSLSATLGGQVDFVGEPFDIEIDLPELHAHARMTEGVNVPLSKLFREAGLPAPPDLTVEELEFGVSKDGSLSVAAVMAKNPPWTLELGPTALTVSDVSVLVSRESDATPNGSFSGTLALGDGLELAVAYNTPGDFVMRAELPDVRLMRLIASLTNQPFALPGGFDLAFTGGTVLVQRVGADMVFQFAATLEGTGLAAFEARRVGGSQNVWGFAAAADLSDLRPSSLPGLGALSPFESIFRMDQLVVVVASFDDPGFQFPALAAFKGPDISAGELELPSPEGGVVRGLNIHGHWTLDTASREQELLRKFLGLNPSLGITLQVGVEPAKDSRLYVNFETTIQGHPFSCKFGGQMKDGKVGLFLSGSLEANIQGRLTRFDVLMLFVANGAFLSGSMLGSISFEGITLSNLVLVVGINGAGIPSLGIAATLSVGDFHSSLAVFFDSTDPSRSMLAGAVSDLTLHDVLDTFAGGAIPSEVDVVLSTVALVGTNEFIIGTELAPALDNLQVDAVSAAFAKHGVNIPSDSSQVLLVVGERGKSWQLTDLTEMLHYELVKNAGGIRVTLNPQFYCVPQATSVGPLRFEQGMFLNAGLRFLGFDASAEILVKPSQGITVDGRMDRIVIGSASLFCLESNEGEGKGPRISAATFSQPTLDKEALRGPHFLLDGRLSLLGIKQATYVIVNANGLAFDIKGPLGGGGTLATYSLKGHVNGPANVRFGGAIHVEIGSIDFGLLGSVNIDTGADGAFDAGWDGSKIWARFDASFEFAGQRLTLPQIHLGVNAESLPGLPEKVFNLVKEELHRIFRDSVGKWLKLVGDGVVKGVEEAASVLKSVYGMADEEAARALRFVGYSSVVIAKGLESAYGLGAEESAKVLRAVGWGAEESAKGLQAAYHVSAKEAAQALKAAEYNILEVGGVLKGTFNQGATEAITTMRQVGYGALETENTLRNVSFVISSETLKQAGYIASEIAQVLNQTGLPLKRVTTQLVLLGYGTVEIGGAFKDFYKLGVQEAASTLKAILSPVEDVGKVLRNVYSVGGAEAAQTLKRVGYAADQVGLVLKVTYNELAGGAAQMLKGAGYAADQVGLVLKSGYGATTAQAVLMLKGAGYAANEVGDALKSAFGSAAFGSAAEEAAQMLKDAGYGVGEIGGVLNTTYGRTANQAARILKDTGFEVERIGGALKSAYGATAAQLSGMLFGLASPSQLVGALKSAFGAGPEEAARLLKGMGWENEALRVNQALTNVYATTRDQSASVLRGAGYAANEVGGVLKVMYNSTIAEAGQLLKNAGYAANEVGGFFKSDGMPAHSTAALMRHVGFAAAEAGSVLQKAYGETATGVVQLLMHASYGHDQIGGVLKSAFGMAAAQAAQFLKGAHFKAIMVGLVLKDAYGVATGEGARMLKGAGYAVNEVGDALKSGWGASAVAVAGGLKGAGYAVNETGEYVKNAFGLAPDALKSTLEGVGYAGDQINGFFNDLGGDFKNFGDDVGDGIKNILRL